MAPIPRRDGSTDPDGGGGDPDPDPDPRDRYVDIGQQGIAPDVTVLFPDKNKIVCLSGVEVLGICEDFNSRIKTYWRETNAN